MHTHTTPDGLTVVHGKDMRFWRAHHRIDVVKAGDLVIGTLHTKRCRRLTILHTDSAFGGHVMGHDTDWLKSQAKGK